MAARGYSGTAVALVWYLLCAPDAASAAVPNGSQFQVNTYTTNNQSAPSIASEGAGKFVVVWHGYGSFGADSSGASIHGERYDASGAPIGGEFQVNTYTTGGQLHPSVASSPDGKSFVVVWQSDGSAGSDTSLDSIQGKRYLPEPSFAPSCGAMLAMLWVLAFRRCTKQISLSSAPAGCRRTRRS